MARAGAGRGGGRGGGQVAGNGLVPRAANAAMSHLQAAPTRAPGGSHAPTTVPVGVPAAAPARPHSYYDGVKKPTLQNGNLAPGFNVAQRPSLGAALPAGHPDAAAQTKLNNLLANLYKGTKNPANTVIGDGRTADAHRWEVLNPTQQVGGRSHAIKSQQSSAGLTNWMRKNQSAPQAWHAIARAERDNLDYALRGN